MRLQVGVGHRFVVVLVRVHWIHGVGAHLVHDDGLAITGGKVSMRLLMRSVITTMRAVCYSMLIRRHQWVNSVEVSLELMTRSSRLVMLFPWHLVDRGGRLTYLCQLVEVIATSAAHLPNVVGLLSVELTSLGRNTSAPILAQIVMDVRSNIILLLGVAEASFNLELLLQTHVPIVVAMMCRLELL